MTSDSLRRSSLALLVATTLWLGGPSCASHSDGVEVAVMFQSEATPASFDTDLLYSIELDTAYVTISAVELVPCSVVEAPALLGPSVARAHTAGSPTVLGEPHVVDLVGLEGMHELLGTLFPPPGDYCGLEVMIGPADADAEGLPAAIDLVGTSVHLAGTLTPSGGAPRAFLLESASELHVELTFAAPLSLSLEASPAGALAATDHLTWLDGIDFDVDSTATQEAALLANLSASLVAVPIPATPAP